MRMADVQANYRRHGMDAKSPVPQSETADARPRKPGSFTLWNWMDVLPERGG
jgi:hypothetical protein